MNAPASTPSDARGLDRYAVAGNPVAHSRSPSIHALFAAQTGQTLDYGRLLCPLDGFKATLTEFVQQGARGCNVTVPFKFEAFEMAARHTPRAVLAHAANTLRFDSEADGGWLADNTDGVGLVRDITANAGVPLQGRRVLLLGAGGASAGVLGPLIEQRPRELVLANRTVDKARALVERHQAWATQHGVALQARALTDAGEGFDVLINGTAASLGGGEVPVGAQALKPGSLALDMMYGPAAQPFLDWARAQGAMARDGLGMLVEQAAESFALWRGVRPDTRPVLAQLRAEVDSLTPEATR
ncbi:shikimate dehydrogenase [Aquabacterium soli]|uniref:Shikimate dehydrogenase (NADP(+)) n=1 Tax=Aquabacterium soli TaxID=2493092 RepID=A0A3R8T895_9BURK|nr:shikimate dehydrogenase [Aquabacterium soli]RRS06316.1 shikimate dehydrogenase [Aquabacterium soli]